ncbi:MAG TPA: L-lactate dehydrogenase [Patescibacteria group bacterium]
MMKNSNKVSFIGCGKVGMTAAYALFLDGSANEIVLLGRCKDDIVGEELDLEHALSFVDTATVKSTERYEDIAESDVVVITAGAAQKPGETRLDLAQKNTAIIEDIIPKVVAHAPDAIIVIVSNPVDILTYKAYQLSGLPKGRIFGSGTVLDSARFRFHLSEFLKVSPQSIHAYILGEHGDSSFPVISSASVGGQPLQTFEGFSEDKAMMAYEKARTAAAKIIESKGATYYAIGVVILKIIKTILRDSKSVLPVSVPLHGYYGHYGVALSVPSIVGRQGVERSLEIKMNWEEKSKLEHSVNQLKKYL